MIVAEELQRENSLSDGRFDTLYNQYAGQLYKFCLNYLGSSEDAMDACQEAFFKLGQNINSLDFDRTIAPWLFKVARNICAKISNKRKVKTMLEQTILNISIDQASEGNEDFSALARCDLKDSISKLPDPYKSILILYCMGKSNDEIAKILDINRGSLRVYFFRAMQALKLQFNRRNSNELH